MIRPLLPAVESIGAARQTPLRPFLKPLFAMAILSAVMPSFAPLGAQTPQAKESLLKNYGKIPLHFEPNVGQADAEAKFISRGNGYAFFLTPSEAVLVLRQSGAAQRHAADGKLDGPLGNEPNVGEHIMPQAVLHTRLLGANATASISAGQELPGKSNYFIGNDAKKWRTNIPSYGNVKYEQVYPGVDLVYYGNQSQLEYGFVVAPGANPKRIRLAISGEEISSQAGASRGTPITLRVDANGDLVVTCGASEVRYQKPVAYQTAADGQKQLVAARFVLKSKNEVGFAMSSYDRARTLVIDPTLIYSTYIAGATPGFYYFGYTGDQAAAIAVDSNGSAYITGLTESADFPLSGSAYQTTCKPFGNGCLIPNNNPSGQYAVFVSKLSPDGSSLVYSTYLGGSYNDNGAGIAVDSSGDAYIAGSTNSPDFPTTPGAYQTVCSPEFDELHGFCTASGIVSKCGSNGYPDGFVTKLNSTGSGLVYSTFLGGSLNDYLTGIALDPAGEAYVSGFTLSSYGYGGLYYGCGPGTAIASYGYPITPGGYFPGPLPTPPAGQPWPFGRPSAFTLPANSAVNYPFGSNHTPVFSKLSADGSTLLYSTYIGGGFGPAFPSPGSTTLGDGQTFYPYLQQHATGIAVDSSGDAYLTGYSNASDQCCMQFGNYQFSGFPTTPGALQPHNASDCASSNCAYDGFVAKFDPTQSGTASLVYSTNLGGRGDDYVNAIAVDSGGNAYVVGTANQSGYGAPATFPTTPGTLQSNCPGDCTRTYGWVAKLNSTASTLDYATYLSGTSAGNSPSGVKVDSAGNAYVGGQTSSRDFPQQNPLQGYPGGALTSAFVSVLDPSALTLLFSSFLGGDNQGAYANNGASGIALDGSNNIYVTGSTTSSSFPATTGAFQETCAKCATGSWGVFVSEISAVQSGPTLQSISVSPSSASISAGLTQQFTAIGYYSDNSSKDLTTLVTWSSSSTGIATISNTSGSQGLATGIAAGGPVTITATQNSVSGTAQLTVTAAALQSISVTPSSPSVPAGLTQQFTATGHYSDASTQDLTASVSWSSSDATIATISNAAGSQGLATGVAAGGPVTITATQSGISGTAQLTVTAAALQSISVSPGSASVAAGLTQQFLANGHYSDGSNKDVTAAVNWSSSNANIVTVSNTAGSQGLAKGVVAGGPVTVTAAQGGISGSAQLTVTAAVLQSISVTPSSTSVSAGFTQQFTATGHYSDGTTQSLTASASWSSSSTNIATISNAAGSQGLAKGVAAGGPVTIMATQSGVSGTAQLTVTAPVLVSIAVTPVNPSVPAGSAQQFTATGTYSDGSQLNVTGSVTWGSSNAAVATINSSGVASALAAGSTTISAQKGALSNSTTMTVVTLQSLTISPLSPSILVGRTVQFAATGHYSDGSARDLTSSAAWSSSKMSVATITSPGGLATGIAKGTTTIKAVVGAFSTSTTLMVNAVTLQSITVTPATASVSVGGTQQFKATGTYNDGSVADITSSVAWSSSPKNVASVNSTGLATGLKAGTDTITAKSGNVSGSATLTVH